MNDLNKIGDRIRVCRVEKKLSQENVAHAIGISITAYSKIERGKTNVSISRLTQIADCFDVPLVRLMHPMESASQAFSPIDTIRGSGYMYHHDINNQALLTRIESLQEELTRLNKTIAEKDGIITLLKEVLTGKDKKKKKDK